MAAIKRFEELECWQDARTFVNCIYKLCKKDCFKKDYELTSQIKRSAISSMANIAEGFHRNSNKDFMKFLDYSRTSIAETISHCYVAFDQGYITESEMKEINEQADRVWRKINSFIAYLKSSS